MTTHIYLDNHATTPTDPRVRDAMLPFFELDAVGNPHSEHVAGRRAAAAVENGRKHVADLIGARPEEIVFTSGATEANNIVLQGLARAPRRRGNHVLTCATEHKCVLETMAFLERGGFRVEILPVDSNGIINVLQLEAAITDETAFVSVMTANNEIGVLQPIAEIAAICRSREVALHTDAAQAAGKVALDVKALGVDFLSISGHKIYAPVGIGALYISDESPISPEPLFWGGGQERGLRSGTLAPPLCVAMGAASAIAVREMQGDANLAAALRNRFLEIISAHHPSARVNCDRSPRLPGNLSLTLPGVDADRLVGAVQPEISVSTNAACSAGILRPSHVLLALGLSEIDAASTIRIGLGRFNTLEEVEFAGERLSKAASRILESEMRNVAAT